MVRRGHTVAMGALCALMLGACGGSGTGSPPAAPSGLSARAQAGRALFFDASLTFAGGQAPTLDASEIDDVVAFLCTLTDGYDPNNPAAYNVPAQCLPGAP